MDTIRNSKKDLDGAVTLDNYVKKGQLDLDVTGVKRFFARNIKAIVTRIPSRRERQKHHRKELKDLMSTLLENPPGNAISQWENMEIKLHCETCQKVKFQPNTTTDWKGTWDIPERPWERLNIDIRGPLPITNRKNEYLLVIADEFSNLLSLFH
uniref:Integrase_H2C2 domain-containing protein n=1 Tax=Strongyloides papillosus TaxID=174720 RepID=A0A0N5C2V2_STREA